MSSSLDIVKCAAYNLYSNGNDMRQQKNGKPGKLIESYYKSQAIKSIGIFGMLSNDDRRLIMSNDRADVLKRQEWSFLTKISKLLIRIYHEQDEYKTEKEVIACVKFPSLHLYNMALAIANEDAKQISLYRESEIKKMLDTRKIFITQERQKVTGK